MVEQINNEINNYEDIKEIVNDLIQLRTFTEKFINAMIDQVTLGILFDAHRKRYTKTFNLDRDKSPEKMEPLPPHVDIFGNHNLKKSEDCVCPICDRQVAALRFAPHLESCMGMGRSRSRNVRRVTNNNKERENSSFSGIGSDDEDDADWNSNEKRSRKKKDRNGNKKGKGTPKKNNEAESSDTVDIEGEEDGDMISLRDMLQDHSNGSSPSDSSTSSRKREKSKNKKSKRDRTSPSVNLLNAD